MQSLPSDPFLNPKDPPKGLTPTPPAQPKALPEEGGKDFEKIARGRPARSSAEFSGRKEGENRPLDPLEPELDASLKEAAGSLTHSPEHHSAPLQSAARPDVKPGPGAGAEYREFHSSRQTRSSDQQSAASTASSSSQSPPSARTPISQPNASTRAFEMPPPQRIDRDVPAEPIKGPLKFGETPPPSRPEITGSLKPVDLGAAGETEQSSGPAPAPASFGLHREHWSSETHTSAQPPVPPGVLPPRGTKPNIEDPISAREVPTPKSPPSASLAGGDRASPLGQRGVFQDKPPQGPISSPLQGQTPESPTTPSLQSGRPAEPKAAGVPGHDQSASGQVGRQEPARSTAQPVAHPSNSEHTGVPHSRTDLSPGFIAQSRGERSGVDPSLRSARGDHFAPLQAPVPSSDSSSRAGAPPTQSPPMGVPAPLGDPVSGPSAQTPIPGASSRQGGRESPQPPLPARTNRPMAESSSTGSSPVAPSDQRPASAAYPNPAGQSALPRPVESTAAPQRNVPETSIGRPPGVPQPPVNSPQQPTNVPEHSTPAPRERRETSIAPERRQRLSEGQSGLPVTNPVMGAPSAPIADPAAASSGDRGGRSAERIPPRSEPSHNAREESEGLAPQRPRPQTTDRDAEGSDRQRGGQQLSVGATSQPNAGDMGLMASQTSAPMQPMAAERVEIAQQIINQLTDQLSYLQQSDRSETRVTLNQPPHFRGVQLIVTEFNSAKRELNLTFANVQTSEADAWLRDQGNRQLLNDNLRDLGFVVQRFETTHQRDTSIASQDPNAFAQSRDQEGDTQRQQQQQQRPQRLFAESEEPNE